MKLLPLQPGFVEQVGALLDNFNAVLCVATTTLPVHEISLRMPHVMYQIWAHHCYVRGSPV